MSDTPTIAWIFWAGSYLVVLGHPVYISLKEKLRWKK